MTTPDQNESAISKSTVVQKLNARQVRIIHALHADFVARCHRNTYDNGSISTTRRNDPDLKRYTLELSKNGCGKIRSGAAVSAESLGFSRPRENTDDLEMHNVLDLFLNACKKMPGFKTMSAADVVTRMQYKPNLKPAVPPIPYSGNEPAFDFQGSSLFDEQVLKPSALCNALGLGATGSGKTVSMLLPLLKALLRYEIEGRQVSMLVIDPKAELLESIESQLKDAGQLNRLIVLGKCQPIDLFDDDDGLDLSSRFEKIKSLCLTKEVDGDGARWQAFADDLLKSFLRDDQAFVNHTGLAFLESVACLVTDDKSLTTQGPWVAVHRILKLGMNGPTQMRLIADNYDLLMLFAGLAKLERPVNRYIASKDASTDQWFYNARGALTIAGLVGSMEVNALMNLSVRVGWKSGLTTEIAEAVASGKVIVFQPRATTTHDFVGKSLKSLFYRCVMERKDMVRPIAYVCDELQRFITSCPDSGEHTFLDRCRAYRVNCVLATQSVAALQTVINPYGRGSAVIEGILVNCTTKVIFRTPDTSTVEMLKAFIPPNPVPGPHILVARPPASLKTGEYYFSFQDKFGRTRYQLPNMQA